MGFNSAFKGLNVVYTNTLATFMPKRSAVTTLLPKFRHHAPAPMLVPKINPDAITVRFLWSAACPKHTTLSLAFCTSMLFHTPDQPLSEG